MGQISLIMWVLGLVIILGIIGFAAVTLVGIISLAISGSKVEPERKTKLLKWGKRLTFLPFIVIVGLFTLIVLINFIIGLLQY